MARLAHGVRYNVPLSTQWPSLTSIAPGYRRLHSKNGSTGITRKHMFERESVEFRGRWVFPTNVGVSNGAPGGYVCSSLFARVQEGDTYLALPPPAPHCETSVCLCVCALKPPGHN